MPQNKNIPAQGAGLYYASQGDKRPILEFRVGGKVIRARFPGAPNGGEFPPIRESVIYMKDKQFSKTDYGPDPYSGEK